jgi:hypothetical protein
MQSLSRNFGIFCYCYHERPPRLKFIDIMKWASTWATMVGGLLVWLWKVYKKDAQDTDIANWPSFSEGDAFLSAEDKPPEVPIRVSNMGASGSNLPQPSVRLEDDNTEEDYFEEDEESHNWLEGHTAIKFLMAGGIAGAG